MKTKIKLLKVQTAIIMLLLSVLGFSCQKEKCKCSCPAKYKSECECGQHTIALYGTQPPRCFTFLEDQGTTSAEIIGESQPISNDESN